MNEAPPLLFKMSADDIIRISCTAMFICEGLHDAGYDHVIAAAAAATGNGWAETCYGIANYARHIDAEAQKYVALEFDYPGVFDYEVSAPFGRWCGEQYGQHQQPTDTEAIQKIKQLVKNFFTQGMRCSQEIPNGFR